MKHETVLENEKTMIPLSSVDMMSDKRGYCITKAPSDGVMLRLNVHESANGGVFVSEKLLKQYLRELHEKRLIRDNPMETAQEMETDETEMDKTDIYGMETE